MTGNVYRLHSLAAGSAGRARVILFTLANRYSYRVLRGVGAVPSACIPLRGFK